MSATTTETKNAWVARVLGVNVTGNGVAKGKDAGALDALYGELLRVEKSIINAPGAAKPADLKGRFAYATSVLSGTATRLDSLKDEDVVGARFSRPRTFAKMNEVRGMMDVAQTRQIELSLAQLGKVAASSQSEASTLQAQAEALTKIGDAKAAAAARDTLYKAASALLTSVSRERGDWEAQIDEAKVWMAGAAGKFRAEVAKLDAVEKALDKLVADCLPPLTTRPAAPGEKPKAVAPDGKPIEAIEDPAAALKACGNSWVTAKQTYGGTAAMQTLADYRKRVVDEWLTRELGKYGLAVGPGLGWVSVGSTDPTSDYDISINKHGTVDGKPGNKPKFDYEMVEEFNDWFRGKFGAEGGTVFDTNLYAAAPSMVTDEDPDAVSTNDVAALMKMRRYMSAGEFEAFRVETMAACGKDEMQRFKVDQQFAMADINYRIVISEILQSGMVQLRERIKARAGKGNLTKEEQELDTEEKHLLHEAEDLIAKGKEATGIEVGILQTAAEDLAREFDHALKDATLVTTNELYAAKKGDVRKQERSIVILKELDKALKATPVDREALAKAIAAAEEGLGDIGIESDALASAKSALQRGDEAEFASSLQTAASVLAQELSTRKMQLGSSGALTMFFANEAYQSTGPFAHVVTATQAAESEATAETVGDTSTLSEADRKLPPKTQAAIIQAGGREKFDQLTKEEREKLEADRQVAITRAVETLKARRRDEIPNDQCLQSFNEQLGDFLKDLEHYGNEEPGKAIIQSSKYLERLLDAVNLMIGKEMFKADAKLLEEVKKECELQGRIKSELIAARKGNLMLMPKEGDEPVDQAEQRRAYACQFMKELGVNSIAGLAKKYTSLAVRINKAARQSLASA